MPIWTRLLQVAPCKRYSVHISRSFPHVRHACGFKLANDGHDTRAIQAYLGHRSIMSTVRYRALTPNRFKIFGKTNALLLSVALLPKWRARQRPPEVALGTSCCCRRRYCPPPA